MKIFKKFKIWWRGKWIPPTIKEGDEALWDPDKLPDKYEKPELAKLLIIIGRFWLRHWKFIITIIVAIIAIIVKGKIK